MPENDLLHAAHAYLIDADGDNVTINKPCAPQSTRPGQRLETAQRAQNWQTQSQTVAGSTPARSASNSATSA